MSLVQGRIGCPHCDARDVDLGNDVRTDGGEPRSPFPDADRLKGTTVDCDSCGDEFEVYFY